MWWPQSTHVTQWHLPPPLASTVKSPLFTPVQSTLLGRLHPCCTNHSPCIYNGWTFSGQTSYIEDMEAQGNWKICPSSYKLTQRQESDPDPMPVLFPNILNPVRIKLAGRKPQVSMRPKEKNLKSLSEGLYQWQENIPGIYQNSLENYFKTYIWGPHLHLANLGYSGDEDKNVEALESYLLLVRNNQSPWVSQLNDL